jgi:hypothetical protein
MVVCLGCFRGDADGYARASLDRGIFPLEAARRRAALAAAAAITITLVAFPPAESLAQTSSGNAATGTSDLLQPSLQGNAATPQGFRKPGQKRPSAEEPPPTNTFAPSRIGATPR